VKPTDYCCSKTYWKVYDKIFARSRTNGIKKSCSFGQLNGTVYEPYGANGLWYEMQLKIARKLILANGKRD
jgi:long-chain acyl-CoA synthetase